MRKSILTFAVASFVATTATAQTVDLKKSTFQWTGSKKIGSTHTGKVTLKSANVVRNNGVLSSAEFVIDMTSISNEDLEGEWNAKLVGHLKSADFFDVAKFPTAKLKLDREVDNKTVSGKLTIKDKTMPVKIEYERDSEGYFTGRVSFDRTKFGVIYGSGNFFKGLGDKVISDEVTIDFRVYLSGTGRES